jgi:hypothetical protein
VTKCVTYLGDRWTRTLCVLATLLLVPVLDISAHNLSSYKVSLPFVKPYVDQDFSHIFNINTPESPPLDGNVRRGSYVHLLTVPR